MSEEVDYVKLEETLKIDIEYASDIVDSYFGTVEEICKEPMVSPISMDSCLKERLTCFQELLRVLFAATMTNPPREQSKSTTHG